MPPGRGGKATNPGPGTGPQTPRPKRPIHTASEHQSWHRVSDRQHPAALELPLPQGVCSSCWAGNRAPSQSEVGQSGSGGLYSPPTSGDWRSWLARFLDMEEVTGSSPVSLIPREHPTGRKARLCWKCSPVHNLRLWVGADFSERNPVLLLDSVFARPLKGLWRGLAARNSGAVGAAWRDVTGFGREGLAGKRSICT